MNAMFIGYASNSINALKVGKRVQTSDSQLIVVWKSNGHHVCIVKNGSFLVNNL